MKNNAWFFGDSFTYGEGCREGFEYYDNIEYDDKRIWTSIVSDELNLKHINLGIRGASSPIIISTIIEYLPEFNEGDYVIISDSLPNRTIGMNEKRHRPGSITTDIFEEEYGTNNFFETKESQKSFFNYLNNNVIPYTKEWKTFYERQFEQIQKHLIKYNINCYYWSHLYWAHKLSRIHTIEKHTDGLIKDGHFSWIEHKKFSEYILNNIENKNYLIGRSTI